MAPFIEYQVAKCTGRQMVGQDQSWQTAEPGQVLAYKNWGTSNARWPASALRLKKKWHWPTGKPKAILTRNLVDWNQTRCTQ